MTKATCIFCQVREADTDDHTPAKIFLPRPYPPNLVVVPACRGCNASFQRDDEYFRLMLTSREGVDENPVGRQVLDRAMRNLDRPASRGLQRAIIEAAGMHPVIDEAGQVVGHAPAFVIEAKRIERSLEHIVRGVFWKLTGDAFPPRIRFRANLSLSTDSRSIELMRGIIAGRPVFELGEAFRCVWAEAKDYPFFSAWLVEFYGTEQFAVFTVDPERTPPDQAAG